MRILLCVFFILMVIPEFMSQKKGVIRYSVKAEKQDTTIDAIMSTALLQKSEFTFTFKKKRRARVQLKAGTFFEFVTIFDHKKGKYLRLTDDQKNKVAKMGDIFVLPDSVYYMKSKYKLVDDTMNILGYQCRKAIAETKNGQLVCWYTTEIAHNFKSIDFIEIDVPGMPLYFMSTSGKVKMIFEAKSIDKLKKEDRKKMKLKIPEGYITGDELKKK
jgi:GLPGLI family protein